MLSVMKKRSMTRSSGVVETFTRWIVSSSSERSWVTSEKKKKEKTNKHTHAHKFNHNSKYGIKLQNAKFRKPCLYHVTSPSDQGKIPSTGRLVKGWVSSDSKRKPNMKGRRIEVDFLSLPTSLSSSQNEESPKTPHNTISRRLKYL